MSHYIFFPFTHMTECQLKSASAFFPQLSYLPLQQREEDLPHIQKAVEAGEVQRILLPSQALDTAKQRAVQYTQWAKIHKGNEHNLKAILKESAYFTSDTQVTAIKSQIKGRTDDEIEIGTADKPGHSEHDVEKALLFLTMAQMCDEQNEQIDLELKAVEKNRGKLLAELRGSEDSLENIAEESVIADTDAGLIMTRERIASWASAMALAGGMDNGWKDCFLVTTSPAVMDYLESICTDVINALDIDQIKVHENNCSMKNQWQHQFCESLMQAVHGGGIREKDLPKVTDSCLISGQIKLSVFSGDLINELLKMSGRQIVVCLVNLK